MARFLRQLALAACALISLATTTSAGINTWTSVGPEGGDIYDLAITSTTPAVAYALTPLALYRSEDTGRTWSQVGAPFQQSERLIVHPTQANRVFILADGQLLTSTDGGATRTKIAAPATASGTLRYFDFSNDGSVLYASDGHTLYRSSDLGTSWMAGGAIGARSDETIRSLFLDPINANRVIASLTQSGVFITHDGGDHWAPFPLPLTTVVDALAFSYSGPRIWIATPDGVYQTSDEGATWTLAAPFRLAAALAVHPQDPSIVYAQVGSSIYRTTDGGAQWTAGNGTSALWYVNSFVFDPQVRDRLLMATLNGIWVSNDGGANWSQSNRGLIATTSSRFTATTNRTYFVVRGNIYYLEPGATTAQMLDPASLDQALATTAQQFLYTLHADRVPSGDRLFVSAAGSLVRSTDGGQTWARIADPLWNNVGAVTLDVAPDNPDLVIAASWKGIVQSIDGGDHWSTTTGVPANAYVPIIVMAPAGIAYAAGGSDMYKTTNSGMTWTRVNVPTTPTDQIYSVLVQRDAVYLATGNNSYRSTDGGTTWSPLSAVRGGYFAADETGLYLTDGPGASRSIDGGATWNRLAGGSLSFGSTGLQLDPNARGRLLTTTWSGGVHTYTIATDLTVTASGQPSVPPASGVRTEVLFTVTNRGSHAATGVKLNINVAGGRDLFENADCTVNASARSTATCTVAPIPAGQSKLVRIQSSFETAGPLSITASVAANEAELTAADNTSSDSWSYIVSNSSGGGSGGGGGGGSVSWWMLLALAGFAAERRRVTHDRR